MKFIQEEQNKINPPKKEIKKYRGANHEARERLLEDDSISEITDLEQEEILFKYYDKKLSSIERKRNERAVARKRLLGKKVELKHICNTNHKMLSQMNVAKNHMEEKFEFEIMQKTVGKLMHDDDLSAH